MGREWSNVMAATEHPLVLVTGGSSGIGLELAKVFAAEGHDIVLTSSSAGRLRKAAVQVRTAGSEHDIAVSTVPADLAKTGGANKLYRVVEEMGRPIDILVNNAGVGVWGDFVRETALTRELAMMQLNNTSAVVLTKLFAAEMVKRNEGKILFNASESALAPMALMSVYAATSAFIYSFALSLREELKDTGVSVTALLAGGTQTDFFNRAEMQDAKFVKDGSLADPAQVARDGYDALMRGDDHVVTPTSARMMAVLTKLVPDRMAVTRAE
jgi:short-subunit dehydrogenase